MENKILINVTNRETRVASLEKGTLTQVWIERTHDAHLAGNVYLGRVVRVLPGIQSAFVDIGLDKAAFLYVDDIQDAYAGLDADDIAKKKKPIIQGLLKEGQDLMVQVTKEPIGTKGAKVTSNLTLPGRYLVYMPNLQHVGVSRKIRDEEERKRLKDIALRLKEEDGGFIIRTVSEGVAEEALLQDMRYLVKLWKLIEKKAAGAPCPSLVHQELSMSLKIVRDSAELENTEILVDDLNEYDRLKEFMETFAAQQAADGLRRYEMAEPIFTHFGVELEIDEALKRKVWLKSGGYIIIEQTEALVSIDVNTGKYVGKKNSEDTILKTNLEAVKEIAYQLRLRDVGGLIVIDFIDMEQASNRKKVVDALRIESARDKALSTILPMSEFGLVEMTRQRIRDSLYRTLKEPCAYCEGKGYIKSRETVAHEILRQLRYRLLGFEGMAILISCHPSVSDSLYQDEQEELERLENDANIKILIKGDRNLHQEEYEILDAQTRVHL